MLLDLYGIQMSDRNGWASPTTFAGLIFVPTDCPVVAQLSAALKRYVGVLARVLQLMKDGRIECIICCFQRHYVVAGDRPTGHVLNCGRTKFC